MPGIELVKDVPSRSGNRANNDAINTLFAHASEESRLPFKRLPRIGKKGDIACSVELRIDANRQFCEKRIADEGHQQSNGLGLASPKICSPTIVDIAHGFDRVAHALPRLCRNERTVTEHERHGGARNTCLTRDVGKRNGLTTR